MKKKSTKYIIESTIPIDDKFNYSDNEYEKNNTIYGLECPYCSKEISVHKKDFKSNKRFSYCPECQQTIFIEYKMELITKFELKIKQVKIGK